MTAWCQKLLWVRVFEGSYKVFVEFYLWRVVLARAVTDVMNRSWFEQAYFLWHVNTVYCCDKFDKQEVRIKFILNLKVQQVFKPDRFTNLYVMPVLHIGSLKFYVLRCRYFFNHFLSLAVSVEAAYLSNNSYHNSTHAADVTQAMHCYLSEPQVRNNIIV